MATLTPDQVKLAEQLVEDMRARGKKYKDLSPKGRSLLDSYRSQVKTGAAPVNPPSVGSYDPKAWHSYGDQPRGEDFWNALALATGGIGPVVGKGAIGFLRSGAAGRVGGAIGRVAGAPAEYLGKVSAGAKQATQARRVMPPVAPPVAAADDPVKQMLKALEEAGPARAETAKLQSAERARRLPKALTKLEAEPTMAGVSKMRKSLAGKLPTAQFKPILDKVDTNAVNSMISDVSKSERLAGFEKVEAARSLQDLLVGKKLPIDSEIELLGRVFGPVFARGVQAAAEKAAGNPKATMRAAQSIAALPRAARATADLSAPLRQGIVMLFVKPRQYLRAFVDMHKYLLSPSAYDDLAKNIVNDPMYEHAKGLALNAIWEKSGLLTHTEEIYMGANLLKKLPLGLGRAVRASERAYTGFLTKLRFDSFKAIANDFKRAGLDITSPDRAKDRLDLIKFINSATGRGDLGVLEQASEGLAKGLFAPKLMASRVNLLNPKYYKSLDPAVRRVALHGMKNFVSAGMGVLGLAAAAGMRVGTDPNKADFGKIRVGKNTRIDVWGGFQQYVRLMLRVGSFVNQALHGQPPKFGEDTAVDMMAEFLEFKAAPGLPTIALKIGRGRGFRGEPLSPGGLAKDVALQFVPLLYEDMYELMKLEKPGSIWLALPAAYGVGIQTYEDLPTGRARRPRRPLRRTTRP